MKATKTQKLTVLMTVIAIASLAFATTAYAGPVAISKAPAGAVDRMDIDSGLLDLADVEYPAPADAQQMPAAEPAELVPGEPADEPVPDDEPYTPDEPEDEPMPGDEPFTPDEPSDEPVPAAPTDEPAPTQQTTSTPDTTATPTPNSNGGRLAYTGGNQIVWMAVGLAIIMLAAAVFFAGRSKKQDEQS